MSRRARSLGEISERYPFILVDTSTLSWSSIEDIETSPSDFEIRMALPEEKMRSAMFFKEFLEGGKNFYVTPLILRQYDHNTHYPYGKIIKNRKNLSRKGLELYRKRRETSREIGKLVRAFEGMGGILEFDEDERRLYGKMSSKYSFLKKRRDISEANFDFLISGVVVSMKRGLTSLLSNNFLIFYSWIDLLKKEKLTPEQLGFFVRKDFDVFKRGKL